MKYSNQIGACTAVIGALSCAFLWGGQVFAQGAEPSSAGTAKTMDELIVTTQRREQTLLEVPVAVNVVDGDALDRVFFDNVQDLSLLVPSLTIADAVGLDGTAVRIRGVGTSVFSVTVEPSVSFVIDGVVLARNGSGLVEFSDIERIEVLRGPQGTLFGKNSSAGVISYITKDTAEEFEASLKFRGAELDEYRVDASVSGPINDNMGFRVTGFYREFGDYYDNVFLGIEDGAEESYGVRAKLDFDVGSNVYVKISGDYLSQRRNCCDLQLREAAGTDILTLAAGVIPSTVNTDISNEIDKVDDYEQWGASLEVQADLGPVTLTSLTAYRDWSQNLTLGDTDFFGSTGSAPVTGAVGLQQGASPATSTVTQEFRLTSNTDGRFDYVLGLFYFRNETDRFFDRDVQLCFAGLAVGSPCLAPFETDSFFTLNVDNTNLSAFGDTTFGVTDRLSLIGGIRFIYEENSFETAVFNGFEGSDEATDFAVIGRAGVQYDITDEFTAFATYARGYKGLAFDATLGITTAVLDAGAVDPETANAFELGFRGSPFGWSNVFIDLNLFYSLFQNLQVQAFNSATAAASLLNAGESVARGVELTAVWDPTDELSFTGGVGFTDAFFSSFTNAACFAGQTAAQGCMAVTGGTIQDVSGRSLPNSPEWKFNLQARYEKPISGDGPRVYGQVNANYQSEVQFAINQNPGTVQDGYALVDLAVGVISPNDRIEASFFVRNVGDKSYAATIGEVFINDPGGFFQIIPRNAQRRFGGSVALRF